MDDQTYAALAARLERDRDKVVQKASAILCGEDKLEEVAHWPTIE